MENNLDKAKELYEKLVSLGMNTTAITQTLKDMVNALMIFIESPRQSIFGNLISTNDMIQVKIIWKNNKTNTFYTNKIPM